MLFLFSLLTPHSQPQNFSRVNDFSGSINTRLCGIWNATVQLRRGVCVRIMISSFVLFGRSELIKGRLRGSYGRLHDRHAQPPLGRPVVRSEQCDNPILSSVPRKYSPKMFGRPMSHIPATAQMHKRSNRSRNSQPGTVQIA